MDKNVEWVNEQKILRTIKALESNNMNGYLVKDEKELISKIEELVPEGSKVTCGGSMSLFETGVMEHLRSGRYDFLDRNKEGLTGEEILERLKELAPRVRSQVAVESLDFLHRGGRCSQTSYYLGSALRIKPIINIC